MYVSKNDYNRIKSNYEEALRKNEESFIAKKNKIYLENPRLGEIDYEINNLQVTKVKQSIFNNSTSKEIKEIDNNINVLKKEKNLIIKNAGYTSLDIQKNYYCSECKDTGYINNNMCLCLKKFFVDFVYENSHLKDKFAKENFSTFNMNYYSKAKLKGEQFSPYENMEIILKAAHEFCDNFNGEENLFLFGQSGLGKTFLCNAIAKELLDKAYSVVYYSACDLFKIISDDTFRKENYSSNHILDNIYNADLLIIDDLGTEFATSLSTSEFFRIMNSRIDNKKSTIISSNFNLNVIRDTYSERISSRMVQNYTMFKFIGEDIRIKSKLNKVEK